MCHIASVSKAALAYEVPKTTLLKQICGRVARIETGAISHKLTPTEEQPLLEWILNLDERGFPLGSQDLRSAAEQLNWSFHP